MNAEALLEFRSLVFASAMKMARNCDDAEDLTQSVYLKALEALPRFDGRYPKAWLLKILYNCFLDLKRCNRRYAPLVHDYESSQDVPRQAIARIDLAKVIVEADPYVLTSLMHGNASIARQGRSLNAIQSRVARGRRELRKKYA